MVGGERFSRFCAVGDDTWRAGVRALGQSTGVRSEAELAEPLHARFEAALNGQPLVTEERTPEVARTEEVQVLLDLFNGRRAFSDHRPEVGGQVGDEHA